MSNGARESKPRLSLDFQRALKELEDRFFRSVEFYTENNTWGSSRFARYYIGVIRAVAILIIRIRGVYPEKNEYFLRIIYILSSPHIVDYFYYGSNRKTISLIALLVPKNRHAASLFVLQCLTRPSFKIDYAKIHSLLDSRELWPLIISKGVEFRFFSNNSIDLEEQLEFIYNNIQTFTGCLVNDNLKGFEQYLRWYVASPPISFSINSKKVYEAYRSLEQATLLRFGESLPSYISKKKNEKQNKYRVGFALVSLMTGVEFKLALETMDSMPENYHCVIIGLNDEKYTHEFETSLREKNIELALMDKTDVAGVLAGIRELNLDILVFCSPFWGHFLSRIGLIAAARAAPIQIAYIGDVITTGLKSCDYFVIPSKIDNPKIRQRFTENLLPASDILRSGFQFYLNTPAAQLLPNEDKSCVRYFSNAHMWKLNGDLIDAWAQILSKVDRAVIRLAPLTSSYHKSYLPVLRDLIARKCEKWAISVDRFEIIQDSGADLIQKHMAMADVFLDSFPYTGSISLLEALKQSVPVVSLTGDSYPESLSRAVLAELDLEQGVLVKSVDGYVARAIAFGRDAELRKMTSQKLREMVAQMNGRPRNDRSLMSFWNQLEKLLQDGI